MFGNKDAFAVWLGLTICLGSSGMIASSGSCQDDGVGVPIATAASNHESPDNVDFERHVAPLLGRHGCNSAACHGAFGGKGGLQLSLFGFSSELDYQNLRDYVDDGDPQSSLMLQKPSGLEEHEGGIRFDTNSSSYQTIERWIQAGAIWNRGSGNVVGLSVTPNEIVFSGQKAGSIEPEGVSVSAEFRDGSTQDVTDLCQFTSCDEQVATVSNSGEISRVDNGSTTVIVSYRNEFASVGVLAPFPSSGQPVETDGLSDIDLCITDKLNKLNLRPSPPADDVEFLRRVTLDTIGTIPGPDEIERFCQDTSPDKRKRKIDELLVHPMHAALWATRMCDITRCDVQQMGEDRMLGTKRAQMWHDWLRQRFAENTAYSEIVRRIVTATSRGPLDMTDWVKREESLIRESRSSFTDSYADREYLDLYWRRIGEDGKFPLKETAELTAAAFTGVRIHCAQCHKHPFDRWTQDDYAAFTNIFSNVIFGNSTELNVAITTELERRRAGKRRGEKVASLPQLREVFVSSMLGRNIPGSDPNSTVQPSSLGSQQFEANRDLRQQFYEWLIDEQNPYFARNFVNRVWSVYFGVGIIDPVDDFAISNPASHPQLLDALSEMFRTTNFDIRHLEKQILMSDAYQRSSTPNESNRRDGRDFARQRVRLLMGEVVLDCLNQALGTTDSFGDDARPGALAIEIGTNNLSSKSGQSLKILGRGERNTNCDCSRRTENDLRQFIYMINDESIYEKIRNGSINQLKMHEREGMITQLYLRILARRPTEEEMQIARSHFEQMEKRDQAFEDLVWALLNTREFITNH